MFKIKLLIMISCYCFSVISLSMNYQQEKKSYPPKVAKACNFCSSRHVKCDGTMPCLECRFYKQTCSYKKVEICHNEKQNTGKFEWVLDNIEPAEPKEKIKNPCDFCRKWSRGCDEKTPCDNCISYQEICVRKSQKTKSTCSYCHKKKKSCDNNDTCWRCKKDGQECVRGNAPIRKKRSQTKSNKTSNKKSKIENQPPVNADLSIAVNSDKVNQFGMYSNAAYYNHLQPSITATNSEAHCENRMASEEVNNVNVVNQLLPSSSDTQNIVLCSEEDFEKFLNTYECYNVDFFEAYYEFIKQSEQEKSGDN